MKLEPPWPLSALHEPMNNALLSVVFIPVLTQSWSLEEDQALLYSFPGLEEHEKKKLISY